MAMPVRADSVATGQPMALESYTSTRKSFTLLRDGLWCSKHQGCIVAYLRAFFDPQFHTGRHRPRENGTCRDVAPIRRPTPWGMGHGHGPTSGFHRCTMHLHC